MAILQRETTEFVYIGVSGDLPDTAQVAFLPAGVRPQEQDWITAEIVTSQHQLWQEALSANISGDYFIAILIGEFGNPEDPPYRTTLQPGDYQAWLRLVKGVERPVRIAPVAVEVQ